MDSWAVYKKIAPFWILKLKIPILILYNIGIAFAYKFLIDNQ